MNKTPKIGTVVAVTQNVVVIASHLSEEAAEKMRSIFGNKAKFELVNPAMYCSNDGPQKLVQAIQSEDRRYVILGKSLSKETLEHLRKSGQPFVQFRTDGSKNIIGYWNNLDADQQVREISTQEEIEALRSGKQLAHAG